MLIPSKRLQQGVFEALASQNRGAGSGGGTGLGTMQNFQTNSGGNPGKAYSSSGTWVLIQDTNSPANSTTFTFPVPYLSVWFMFGGINVTGPTAGSQTAQFAVFSDGAQVNGGIGQSSPQFNIPGGLNASGTVPIMYAAVFQPGQHTLDVRINVPNSGTTYTVTSWLLYLFRMS